MRVSSPLVGWLQRKWLLPVLVLLAPALGGCAAPHYRITLTSGAIIETKGKPKLDEYESVYHYKTAYGERGTVPVVGVREIRPH